MADSTPASSTPASSTPASSAPASSTPATSTPAATTSGGVVLNITLTDAVDGQLEAVAERERNLRFIHVDHRGAGSPGRNLIELARRLDEPKSVLVALANRGFMAYVLRGTVTSFVQYRRIPTLWEKVVDGVYQADKSGVVYSYTPPTSGGRASHLVVVFSAIARKMYSASLSRHFEQNFPSIQKYLATGTGVLRIADLGGAIGAYYTNTNALPSNERNIQGVIERVRSDLGLERHDVVTFGSSKGGTGALLHGLLGGYRTVAVDPILADEHYIKVWDDLHFTEGVFPMDKAERFADLFGSVDLDEMDPTAIVCSNRSPQFEYIQRALDNPVGRNISVVNSANVEIESHVDVGRKTLNAIVMLLNMQLYGFGLPGGWNTIDGPERRGLRRVLL